MAAALPYTYGTFFHNTGTEWLDDSGAPNFDEPGAVESIDTYATLLREYGPQGSINNTYTQNSALFAQGRAAMAIESSNEYGVVADPENSTVTDVMGVFPIPPGEGGNHPTVLQWGLSMSRFSENKEAAWEFMQWATSPDMMVQLALEGIVSPRASTSSDPRYDDQIDSELRQEWEDALALIKEEGHPEVAPPGARQEEIRTAIGEGIGAVILGQLTPEEAASQIQTQLEALVEE
ncbi:MAG: extracellular solute-binding protein [Chloroflexi bacterium]|nr:extracellular solute-binding protein [Chloroflexota bacterium]